MHPEVQHPGPAACPLCGMALEPAEISMAPADDSELRDMQRRFWVAVALAAPVVGLDLLQAWPWLQALLATPVVLWCGWPFFVRGWASLRHRHLNMFTLIALGVGVAYSDSLVMAVRGGAVYFEPAAVIVALILLGQVLELRARGRTGAAIQALLGLAPKIAHRLAPDGAEAEVQLAQVQPGDRLRVRPGDAIPVDGVVEDGSGLVNEAMISGEPVPVAKRAGDPVIGATLNTNGSFVMRAQRVGADTVLARIVRLVAEAQRTRAPIQRLADTAAAWFVPVVVGVAVVTFAVWYGLGGAHAFSTALVNAVAVLIIACPCALGLATPMSIMVASGKGAGAGILFRNAEAIETLAKVDTVVLDKTGTLTLGRPVVTALRPAAAGDEARLLALAASLELGSEHPLAAAVVNAARERQLPLIPAAGFEAIAGAGVRGTLAGTTLRLGSSPWLQSVGVRTEAMAPLDASAAAARAAGQTVIFLAQGTEPLGWIAIADPLREGSAAAVEALRGQGLRVLMLTGDQRATAEAVAREAGITEVIAEVRPEQKREVMQRLQAEGHRVAMAGDGINDAPALAQADVGIALGSGADIAMESASVTLVHGDLAGILRARHLSRATLGNIRQNLVFAFLYNSLGIPLAAGVFYPVFGWLLSPMVAAAAMSLSSVSVVSNALRLRRLAL